MKKYTAEIDVMPLKALLDPQGKAVGHGLKNMGINAVENIRIGKHISMEIEASSKDDASKKVEEACKKLLSNPVMESYHFTINEN
ncbi:MAG: phosphoribosylformylglycinamidine synthase subunit PurS [Bacteroidetes bacterium]|nr:MAG: phosphoribosylformylglycinamidine synthase subunit PurS [Bacteroidota bacterium]